MATNLDNAPTLGKSKFVIIKMKNNNKPGVSKVTIDMLKIPKKKDLTYLPLSSNNSGMILTVIMNNGTKISHKCSIREKEPLHLVKFFKLTAVADKQNLGIFFHVPNFCVPISLLVT